MSDHLTHAWKDHLTQQIAQSEEQLKELQIVDATALVLESHRQFIDLARKIIAMFYRGATLMDVIERLENAAAHQPIQQSQITHQIILALRLNEPSLLLFTID